MGTLVPVTKSCVRVERTPVLPLQLKVVLRITEAIEPDGDAVRQSPSGVDLVVTIVELKIEKDQLDTVTG